MSAQRGWREGEQCTIPELVNRVYFDCIEVMSRCGEANGDGQPRKRRQRATLTCTNCRVRKIKCNQERPCSSCVKRGIPSHLCVYDNTRYLAALAKSRPKEQDEAPTIEEMMIELQSLRQELESLRSKSGGENNEVPLTLPECVSNKVDRTVFYGPTCWRTAIKKESKYAEVLDDVTTFLSNKRREWKIKHNWKKKPYEDYVAMETAFPDVLLGNLCQYLPSFDSMKDPVTMFGSSFWTRFIPVVDEQDLLKDFLRIFGKDYSTGTCRITISTKYVDYAKIALIIVVFKLMTLTMNLSSLNDVFSDYDQLVTFAQRLLRFSKSNTRVTLPALQATLLMHALMVLDPSDGNGGDGSNGCLLLKSAIVMGITLGLHRDVDDLYPTYTPRHRILLRSIWRYLYNMDTLLSFDVGIPPSIDDGSIHPNSFGNLDADTTLLLDLTRCMRECCKLMTRSDPVYPSEVLSIISRFENFNNGELKHLSSNMANSTSAHAVVNDMSSFNGIIHRVLAVHAIHTLFELLLEGVPIDDPKRTFYYLSSLKYCVLGMTYLTEILLTIRELTSQAQQFGLDDLPARLVEMTLAIIGASQSLVCRSYLTLLYNELRTLNDERLFPEELNITLADMESMDCSDNFCPLSQAFMSGKLSRNFLVLWSKAILFLQRNSPGRVFSMSYSLMGMVTAYKFTRKYVTDIDDGSLIENASSILGSISSNNAIMSESHGADSTNENSSYFQLALRYGSAVTGSSNSPPDLSVLSTEHVDLLTWENEYANDLLNELLGNGIN